LLKRLKFFFQVHFKSHVVLYGIALFVFLIGVTSGAFTVNAISPNQKGGLADYINEFIDNASNNINSDIDRRIILHEGLRQYCGFAFIIWFLGLSYLGIPFIILAFGIKGFLVGFTTGCVVSFYGAKGLLFLTLCVLPPNIIYIPCITLIVIIALENGTNRYKMRRKTLPKQDIKRNMTSYTLKISILTFVMMIGIVYEMFVVPFFLKLFSNIVKQTLNLYI